MGTVLEWFSGVFSAIGTSLLTSQYIRLPYVIVSIPFTFRQAEQAWSRGSCELSETSSKSAYVVALCHPQRLIGLPPQAGAGNGQSLVYQDGIGQSRVCCNYYRAEEEISRTDVIQKPLTMCCIPYVFIILPYIDPSSIPIIIYHGSYNLRSPRFKASIVHRLKRTDLLFIDHSIRPF
jgi:hypothetical protein